MTKIKICGIMNKDDLDYAVQAGADAVGFVVEIKGSRHCISAKDAADLIRRVPVYTKSVAVIYPRDIDDAVRLGKETGADVLQLHGSLLPGEVAELKGRVRQKMVAAVAVEDGGLEAKSYEPVADAVLLDSMVNGMLGGTGRVHDWGKSAEAVRSLRVPVILAGGLNPENVAQAIERVRPYAVDVSSGIETDGRKDLFKINSFIQRVREYRAAE